MLVSLTKKVSRQQLFLCGQFTREELYYLQKDGWRVEWREKWKPEPVKRRVRKVNRNKHGIPVGRVS